MKKIFASLLLMLALGVRADTNKVENPYLSIAKRNAFGLTDSLPVPILPPATNILAPSVFLTGITKINNVRKVHLVLRETGAPDKFVSLAKDEKLYNIELKKILEDSAFVLNNENNELLSFKANSFPTTITKLPPKLPKSSGKDKRSDEARKRVYEEWKKRRDESK
jgi:type II secretory pathway component PulC